MGQEGAEGLLAMALAERAAAGSRPITTMGRGG
jgi:hypothetical protein